MGSCDDWIVGTETPEISHIHSRTRCLMPAILHTSSPAILHTQHTSVRLRPSPLGRERKGGGNVSSPVYIPVHNTPPGTKRCG